MLPQSSWPGGRAGLPALGLACEIGEVGRELALHGALE